MPGHVGSIHPVLKFAPHYSFAPAQTKYPVTSASFTQIKFSSFFRLAQAKYPSALALFTRQPAKFDINNYSKRQIYFNYSLQKRLIRCIRICHEITWSYYAEWLSYFMAVPSCILFSQNTFQPRPRLLAKYDITFPFSYNLICGCCIISVTSEERCSI